MEKVGEDILKGDLGFPSPPADVIPGSAEGLSQITAGQRALRQLHSQLDEAMSGEAQVLVRLLRRDWERRSADLLTAADGILRELGSQGHAETLPPVSQIEKIAASWSGLSPADLVRAISGFSEKALIAHRMVPWVADQQEVHDHFRACLEAEDAHSAVQGILAELAE